MIRELKIIFILILLINFAICYNQTCNEGEKFVSCEKFRKLRVNQYGHTVSSMCYMDKKTKILSTNYEILTRRYDHVVGIIFDLNQKIFYLPEKINRKFPKLRGISAQNCSIKSISRANFAKLPSLSALLLSGNKITAITSDTFRDNMNLMFIDLRDNQIQFICENAFDHLNALIRTHVNLERNICINRSFNVYGWDYSNGKYDDLAKEIHGNCTNNV